MDVWRVNGTLGVKIPFWKRVIMECKWVGGSETAGGREEDREIVGEGESTYEAVCVDDGESTYEAVCVDDWGVDCDGEEISVTLSEVEKWELLAEDEFGHEAEIIIGCRSCRAYGFLTMEILE